MTDTELKPCPFCGNPKPVLLGPNLHMAIFVLCYKCGAKGLVVNGGHGGTPEEAIAAWNTRSPVVSHETPSVEDNAGRVPSAEVEVPAPADGEVDVTEFVRRLRKAAWPLAMRQMETNEDGIPTIPGDPEGQEAAGLMELAAVNLEALSPPPLRTAGRGDRGTREGNLPSLRKRRPFPQRHAFVSRASTGAERFIRAVQVLQTPRAQRRRQMSTKDLTKLMIGCILILGLVALAMAFVNLLVSGTYLQLPWVVFPVGWLLASAFACAVIVVAEWATRP